MRSHGKFRYARTKPSYEEDYKVDQPLTAKSGYGHGYTFPCLFKVGGDGWVLAQQFKRSCLPDGPKVGTVSLSPRGDWRMPSDAKNPYAL